MMVTNNTYFIRHLLFVIAISTTTRSISQQKLITRSHYLSDNIFKGNHLQVNFSLLSVLKGELAKQTGEYPAGSKSALGLSVGLKYNININNEYSLLTGVESSILGRTFLASFKKDDFSPPLISDYKIAGRNSYLSAFVLSVPVSIERRWLYHNYKYFFSNAGLKLNVSTGADFDDFSILLQTINNGYYDAGGVKVYANNDAKPWVSFPLSIGHSWLLRNNNLLQLSICTNISFTKFVNGTYTINGPNQPSTTGTYSSTGTYLGLGFNYVFTNANYRIRKAYEKLSNKN